MPIYTCKNCGNIGHTYKDCPKPILSYGIICYLIENDEIYYLMIQRKDSLSYMEFIKGKYEILNIPYLKQLFTNMTLNEKKTLTNNTSFEHIWKNVWYPNPNINIKYTKEYNESKFNYDNLVKNKKIELLIKNISTPYLEPEWGFPKGRKKMNETPIICANREFYEETLFTENNINIESTITPFNEIFFGTNNILYKHTYYISKFVGENSTVHINPTNIQQIKEIRAIKWLKYEDVIKHIREYNEERLNLFKNIHKTIISLINKDGEFAKNG
jgi:ADP-ribose pyrophosphatase YjhB (NUDIX family)